MESRAQRSGPLVESSDGATVSRIFGFDLNQLYPSTQWLYNNMIGEPTLYGPDAKSSFYLTPTSNLNPYGQEYKAVMVFRSSLEDAGEQVLAMFSNYTNEKRAFLPKLYADALIVTRRPDNDVCTINLFQFDGYFHVRVRNLHHTNCHRNNGNNDLEMSPYYQLSQELAEKRRSWCQKVFGKYYNLRYVTYTTCHFHSPFTLNGQRFANLTEAFDHVRLTRPDLSLSTDHPGTLSIADLTSRTPRKDGSVLAGFVVYRLVS